MIKATQITDQTIYYKLTGIDRMYTGTHLAEGFIPMNGTDLALVTKCGIKAFGFVLASSYDCRQEGACPTCLLD